MQLERGLGLKEALAIVLGTVVGSGIFFKPNVVAECLGRLDLILLVWLAGGAVSAAGSLVYAELAAMMPEAGGAYVYIRQAYGRFFAFLLGWTSFWVARSAAVAALAVAAATLLDVLVPLSGGAQRGVAVGLIVFLGAVNLVGVKPSGYLQDAAAVFKAGGLALLSAAPFCLAGGSFAHWSTTRPVEPALATAFLAVLWAYDGWYNVATVAEEVKDPERDLPRALVMGVGLATVLYLLANLAFHFALSMDAVAGAEQVGAEVARAILGDGGAALVAVLVLGSVVGTLNASILCGPRVFFAMARDGLFLRPLARVHPTFKTPSNSILAFCAWSIVLVLAGDAFSGERRLFDVLTDYVIFGVMVFSIMAAGALFILRRRAPDAPRPYRCWGYPLLPSAFVAVLGWLLAITFAERPVASLTGLAFILAGAPVYWLMRRQ